MLRPARPGRSSRIRTAAVPRRDGAVPRSQPMCRNPYAGRTRRASAPGADAAWWRPAVAYPPAGRGEPPDEVDVLSHPHVLGETRPGCGPPHHQGRSRHVGDARTRPNDAGARTHVKGGTCPLVPGQPGPPRLIRDDARCDRAHCRVREVRQKCVEPSLPGHAVRINKRDKRRVRRGEARVPGRGGSATFRPPHDARSRFGRHPRYRRRIGGTVIDHDHPWHPSQPGQTADQLGLPIADRDHHRDIPGSAGTFQRSQVLRGMSESRIEQATCQRAGLSAIRYRRSGPPAGHVTGAGRREPEHPDGGTTRQHRSARQQARVRVRAQAESGGSELICWPRT